MASVTIGNTNLTQNHPRIISVVSNTAEVYQANSGGLVLFSGLISEKGKESIESVTSAQQLIRDYGNLDIKKYGQAGYNLYNWLQSGGQALVRRVMPDDATYAHAYINIRSKNVGKDVYIQPLISSVGSANTEDTLEYYLNTNGNTNYDGYKDNIIAQIVPVGRGKAYNNLAFRIYSNRQYDNYLNFRLYNIEVIEVASNGSMEVVEGPFAVSFYRDALSPVNDESIFIEDVLAKYSNYIKAKVNDEKYIELCRQICPDASNPYIVDPLFGETRTINGVTETVNGKDVHDAIIKKTEHGAYVTDNEGNYIKRLFVEENSFDSIRIQLEDSALREKYTYLSETRPTEMLEFLSKIKASVVAIGYGSDITEDDLIEDSVPIDKAVKLVRKIISRCTVGGYDKTSTLEAEFVKLEKAILENKLATELKNIGSAKLDEFQTLYSSELKLIVGSSFDSKIAFVQDKIVDFLEILSNLSLDLATVKAHTDKMEQALATLSDKYVLTSEKSELLAKLLDTNFTTEGSLGKLINDTKSGVISILSGNIRTVEIQAGLNDAYKVAHLAQATNSKEVAITNYDNAIIKLYENRPIFCDLVDYTSPVKLRDGSDGSFDESNVNRKEEIEKYLINLYNGNIDPLVTSSKLTKFNFIFDANYSENIKTAIANLASNIRRDFIFIADCGLNSNAKGDLQARQSFNVSTNYAAIYGQNEVIYDPNTGKDIKVTTPYLLAAKFPLLEKTVGLQNPIAGSKRGVVEGFKNISYVPTEIEQEDLYNARVNYIVGDGSKYTLGSQLTSDYKRTPLSDLNSMITMLNVKRDAESIVEGYQFEFIDNDVMKNMQQDLNLNLNKYVTGRACDSIECSVYATEYDMIQHIVRVNISIKFKDIIETVIVTLEVTR